MAVHELMDHPEGIYKFSHLIHNWLTQIPSSSRATVDLPLQIGLAVSRSRRVEPVRARAVRLQEGDRGVQASHLRAR